MKGYMWKRGPRADDKDKKSLTRLLFNTENYKRRYFVLDNVKLELAYYSDFSKTTELGRIDLLAVISVSYEGFRGEDMPSKFPLCLTTEYRDWLMCCENQDDFNKWKLEISNIMKRREQGSTSNATSHFKDNGEDARDGMSLTAAPPTPTIQRTVMDEADFKGKGIIPLTGSGKNVFRRNSKSKLSFFGKRSGNFYAGHNDSFNDDMLQLQRSRLAEESAYNSYTGNVDITATATFSRYEYLEKLECFQVLMSSCDDHLDIATRQQLVTKFLSNCQFEFYTNEGDILISEGSKFEWVYFVLEGEIEQRKN